MAMLLCQSVVENTTHPGGRCFGHVGQSQQTLWGRFDVRAEHRPSPAECRLQLTATGQVLRCLGRLRACEEGPARCLPRAQSGPWESLERAPTSESDADSLHVPGGGPPAFLSWLKLQRSSELGGTCRLTALSAPMGCSSTTSVHCVDEVRHRSFRLKSVRYPLVSWVFSSPRADSKVTLSRRCRRNKLRTLGVFWQAQNGVDEVPMFSSLRHRDQTQARCLGLGCDQATRSPF